MTPSAQPNGSSAWRTGSPPKGSLFRESASTAVTSASMPERYAAFSTQAGCARWRSWQAAASTRTSCSRYGALRSAPALDCAYKLQEYAGQPRRKRSEGKATWPGRKQVWRSHSNNGTFASDLDTLEGERHDGQALLRPVMRGGKRVGVRSALSDIRTHAREQLDDLPPPLKQLETFVYPVEIGPSVRQLAGMLDAMTI